MAYDVLDRAPDDLEMLQRQIKNADRVMVEQLLVSACLKDELLFEYVQLALCDDAKEIVCQVKESIRTSIRKNTKKQYISARSFDCICDDFLLILEQSETWIARSRYELAFDIAACVLLAVQKLCLEGDSSNGYYGVVVDDALNGIKQAIQGVAQSAATQSIHSKMLKKVLKLFKHKNMDDWEWLQYQLLVEALPIITQQNVAQVYRAMEQEELRRVNERGTWHRQDRYLCAQYYFIEKFEGNTAGRNYIEQHLEIDELRKIAVEQDVAQGAFQHAAQLCAEKCQEELSACYTTDREWNRLLFDVYTAENNLLKRAEQAKCLVRMGDLSYYDILKEQWQAQGIWEQEYPRLREAFIVELQPYFAMKLLSKENEITVLMQFVRAQTDACFTYGMQLWQTYETEITSLCKAYVFHKAAMDNNRSHYRSTAGYIMQLYHMGGTQAARSIVKELAENYPRRPALLQELEILSASF